LNRGMFTITDFSLGFFGKRDVYAGYIQLKVLIYTHMVCQVIGNIILLPPPPLLFLLALLLAASVNMTAIVWCY
jgi:hypothetical protein